MRNFTKLFVVLTLIVLNSNCFAKHYNTDVKVIIGRYLTGLDHACQGVVESSIVYIAKMKFDYPDQDYSKVIKKLDDIAENDSSKTTRMKAYVVSSCLKNPQNF